MDPLQWATWGSEILGGWRVDRINRGKEQDCIERLKKAGEIR